MHAHRAIRAAAAHGRISATVDICDAQRAPAIVPLPIAVVAKERRLAVRDEIRCISAPAPPSFLSTATQVGEPIVIDVGELKGSELRWVTPAFAVRKCGCIDGLGEIVSGAERALKITVRFSAASVGQSVAIEIG